MLRTPRDPSRHRRGCTCKGCDHPDTRFFQALNEPRHRDDLWQAVDLQRRPRPVHHQPPAVDLDQFDRDMNDLTRRIGEVGRDV